MTAQLSAGDLARTQATGTNGNGRRGTVNDCLYLTNVGLPTSVGLAVGVGNVLSEDNALSTNAALCHFDTSCMRLHALMRVELIT